MFKIKKLRQLCIVILLLFCKIIIIIKHFFSNLQYNSIIAMVVYLFICLIVII